MFLRVVILVLAATCCTALVIDPTAKQSAWEQSGKFEGDIMLTDEQRNGIIKPASRWPNGEVPYVIDPVFNSTERNTILLAIGDYHQKTAILFRQYNPLIDTDYIHITGEDTGCWSYVGRIGGRQQLNLQRNGCLSHGIIIHELLHALGFVHMHSATDRDNYVTINWQNIQEGYAYAFDKYPANTITSFGVQYDYGSIMHYGPYAFSKNGEKTIEPKDPNANIGQRDGFSATDLEKLAIMYETSTLIENSTSYENSTLYENSTSYETSTVPDNSSYAMPSLFITLILITLNICTHLQ